MATNFRSSRRQLIKAARGGEGRGRGVGGLQGRYPAQLIENGQAVEGGGGRGVVGVVARAHMVVMMMLLVVVVVIVVVHVVDVGGAQLQQRSGELGAEREDAALGRGHRRVGRRREQQVRLGEEAGEAGGRRLAQGARRRRRLALRATVQAEGASAQRHRLGCARSRQDGGAGRRASLRSRGGGRGRRSGLSVAHARLLGVVDEVAARSVRTETACVESAAQVRLVLGVARQVAQLVRSVRELTLVAVLADAALLVRSAQLRLVAARVDVGRRRAHGQRLVHRLAVAAVQLAVAAAHVLRLDGDRGAGGRHADAHALRRRRVASTQRLVAVAVQLLLLLLDGAADGAAVQLKVHLQKVVRNHVAAVLRT